MLRPTGVKIHTDNVSALAVFRMDKLLFLAYFSTSSLTFTCLQTIFQHTVDTLLLGRLRVSIYAILYNVLKYGV